MALENGEDAFFLFVFFGKETTKERFALLGCFCYFYFCFATVFVAVFGLVVLALVDLDDAFGFFVAILPP